MKCPVCGYEESKVIDSRPVEENNSIRRRRECLSCGYRFTTHEVIESQQMIVVKKNGTKEYFNKEKLLSGLIKACEKRPVDAEEIEAEIEAELHNAMCKEIRSTEIGEMVMKKLKEKDVVAYVRFASVYREFTDAATFISEIKRLEDK